MPWHAIDAAAGTIDLYAALIRLRTGHPVLSDGGMRWLHVSDTALAFVREGAEESVLVVASSAEFAIELAPESLVGVGLNPGAIALGGGETAQSEHVTALFGDLAFEADAAAIRISGAGPGFAAWSLPGIDSPPFTPADTARGAPAHPRERGESGAP